MSGSRNTVNRYPPVRIYIIRDQKVKIISKVMEIGKGLVISGYISKPLKKLGKQ